MTLRASKYVIIMIFVWSWVRSVESSRLFFGLVVLSDILEPLRPVKGLDLNDFYRLIEDTSVTPSLGIEPAPLDYARVSVQTPSTSSMWHTVNPVYKMMTTLKLLIEGVANYITSDEVASPPFNFSNALNPPRWTSVEALPYQGKEMTQQSLSVVN